MEKNDKQELIRLLKDFAKYHRQQTGKQSELLYSHARGILCNILL